MYRQRKANEVTYDQSALLGVPSVQNLTVFEGTCLAVFASASGHSLDG